MHSGPVFHFLQFRTVTLQILFALTLACLQVSAQAVRVVKGTVRDIDTHQPIPAATVQLLGSGLATVTNDRGEYRLLLHSDSGDLKFSHVAYFSETVPLAFQDSIRYVDIALRPNVIELPGQTVTTHNYDAAQRIILEAIKRKKEILNRLHEYSFDAYTKLIVRDEGKPDTTNIFLLTETQLTCYWEQPDKYKEIIRARKQSSNIQAEQNLVGVGRILNFNENRIDLGDYQVVSPTADDALDSYNYYLIDTVQLDGRAAFVLEIEPRNQVLPLFEGKIEIADSTYDVVMVDVGFNKGFRSSIVRNPRYSQRFAQFNNEYWMPVEIRFSFLARLNFPGIPSHLAVSHVAALHNFSFEQKTPSGTFDEYAMRVDPDADKSDTLRWNAQQSIPLTSDEVKAYRRIDSAEHAPKPLPQQMLRIGVLLPLAALMQNDFFHFNRVEGAYVGAGANFRKLIPHSELRIKAGYAIDGGYWQQRYGIAHEFSSRYKLWAGITYSDEVVPRPTITVPWGGMTSAAALVFKQDPLDYYRQKGFSLTARGRFLPHTTFRVGYHDFKQYGLGIGTDFSLFNRTDVTRANPVIVNGRMRSVSTSISYDSRKLIDQKGTDLVDQAPTYEQLTTGLEYASPQFISNDFGFRRYFVSFKVRRPVLGLGASNLSGYFGGSDGSLPPQKYFTVPFGGDIFATDQGFQSLDMHNFSGSRIAALTARHEFKRLLWGKSGLPLIKNIPFTLDVYGGAFWTDLRNNPVQPGDGDVRQARTAYSEIGFAVGNLTPFLAPFNLSIGFTWQLSGYDTHRFSLLYGFRL